MQALGVSGQRLQRQPGLPLLPGQLPGAEQAAQVGIAALGLGQQGQMAVALTRWTGAVQRHLGADDGLEAPLLGRLPEAHRAVQPVVVGEGQRRVAQRRRPLDQRLRRRGAVEQGEIAVAVQLDVLQA